LEKVRVAQEKPVLLTRGIGKSIRTTRGILPETRNYRKAAENLKGDKVIWKEDLKRLDVSTAQWSKKCMTAGVLPSENKSGFRERHA